MSEDYQADIRAAVDILRKGGVILYPTDTVWGLGCDATNPEAVRRIFSIKRRSDAKALITLVGSVAALERTVDEIPEVAYQLIECADKPLTIIYDGAAPSVAPELCASDGSIGVRVTREEFSRRLCETLRRPLVSTSANISGENTPGSFAEISPEIIEACDYVCMSRRDEAPGARPSGIIKLSADGVFRIIR